MSPVTRGAEAGRHDSEPGKVSAILETLALFFVAVFLVAMLLALSTVFQNGFD